MPKAMPKTFETVEKHAKLVHHYLKDNDEKDGFSRDENGRKIKTRATLEVEDVVSTGGILFTMPRGHSVRLTTKEQLDFFKVSTKPRLVDLDTGEEVNEEGIPLSLQEFVKSGAMNSSGDFGTDEALADDK